MLTKQHTKRMFAWCKAYFNFTGDMWCKVMFSDEAQIHRFTTHYRYVRRPVEEQIREQIRLQNCEILWVFDFVLCVIFGDENKIILRCPHWLNSDARVF